MIHFSEIANPPQPTYRPICVACDGRGVIPSLSMKLVQHCDKCNGTGKESNRLKISLVDKFLPT